MSLHVAQKPRPTADRWTSQASWLLAGVTLLALALRVWGVTFGLPYLEHPDEPFWIFAVLKMVKTADPNPHDFIYPSLYYYLNAAIYLVYFAVGRLLGAFHSLADLVEPSLLIGGSGKLTLIGTLLGGRILSVLLGCGTVALTFVAGRRLTSPWGGALAALWVAVSPTLVAHDRYMAPDGPMTFFTTWVILEAWLILAHGRTRDYLLAGVALGLAVGMKYNVVVFTLLIVLAHLLRAGWRGWRDWRLYGGLAVSAAVFLLTTPYAVLDFRNFVSGAFVDIRHYAGGHAGTAGGSSLGWYLSYFWQTEGPVLALAATGIVWGLYARSKGVILLAAMALSYQLFIGAFAVYAARTALPLIPLFALLAAWWAVNLLPTEQPRVYPGAAAALITLALFFPLIGTVRDTVRLTSPDSLDTAREWIQRNVPPGARIGVESYSPYVDPQRFVVQGFYKLNDHPPEWFVAEGYDYLVFSERMFRRFYADPARLRESIALYEAIFSAFEEAQVFTDGGYEVRIYHVIRP